MASAPKIWFKSTPLQALSLVALTTFSVLIAAFITALWRGMPSGLSVAIGGMVSVLPNVWFTYALFKDMRPSAARRIVRRFYVNECVKLSLMAGLFLGLAHWLPLKTEAFVIGFVIAQMGVWLAPVLLLKGYGDKHT